MNTEENKNSFDWVWYIMGMIAGMLAVIAVTFHVGYILLGGIIGFILGAAFLNGVVKGRQY
ncbi:MAG: hypothetical protein EOO99_07590 [Pedobacter sp.]|nr:MAG: hypothetical protein EOO99_07590 [Pedobacter sp.]